MPPKTKAPTLVRNLSRANMRRAPASPSLDSLEGPSSGADALVDTLSDPLRKVGTRGVEDDLAMRKVERIRAVRGGAHASVDEDDRGSQQLAKEERAMIEELWGSLYHRLGELSPDKRPVPAGELRDIGSRARSAANGLEVLDSPELSSGLRDAGGLLREMASVDPIASPKVKSRLKRIQKRFGETANKKGLAHTLDGGNRGAMRKDIRKVMNIEDEVSAAADEVLRDHAVPGRSRDAGDRLFTGGRAVGYSASGAGERIEAVIRNYLTSGLYEQFDDFSTGLTAMQSRNGTNGVDEFGALAGNVRKHDAAKGRA